MDYRALEDLINILVKKSGYQLSDMKHVLSKEKLDKVKKSLSLEIEDVKSRLDNYEYFDNNELNKDELERNYLEEVLDNLNNQKNEIESKLEIKEDIKLSNELEVIKSEIDKVKESLKLVNYKLNNRFYLDEYNKNKDEIAFNDLEMELDLLNRSIDENKVDPVNLGNSLLEDFKNNKTMVEVNETLEALVNCARDNYQVTLEEIKNSNIFEIMDNYNNLKEEVSDRVKNDNYTDNKSKEELFEKTKYHNKRIENINNTLEGIEKRKENLNTLINESTILYNAVRSNRISKEEKLKNLMINLYKVYDFSDYENEYEKIIKGLRTDILNDIYLEYKYKNDIQEFNEELRNLDVNSSSLKNEIAIEEKCLEIIKDKMENNSIDSFLQVEDKINLINYSNRIQSLNNEQQYLYVNVDVIKEEIINLWNRNNKGDSEIEEIYEEPDVDMGSMYEENENIATDTNNELFVEEIDDSNIEIDFLD